MNQWTVEEFFKEVIDDNMDVKIFILNIQKKLLQHMS